MRCYRSGHAEEEQRSYSSNQAPVRTNEPHCSFQQKELFLRNWLYRCQKTKSVMETGQIQTQQLQKMDFIYINWKIDRKQEVDKIRKRNPACISGHRWCLPVPCLFWSSISGQHWSWKSPKLSLASWAFLLSVQKRKRRWRTIFLASFYLSVSL